MPALNSTSVLSAARSCPTAVPSGSKPLAFEGCLLLAGLGAWAFPPCCCCCCPGCCGRCCCSCQAAEARTDGSELPPSLRSLTVASQAAPLAGGSWLRRTSVGQRVQVSWLRGNGMPQMACRASRDACGAGHAQQGLTSKFGQGNKRPDDSLTILVVTAWLLLEFECMLLTGAYTTAQLAGQPLCSTHYAVSICMNCLLLRLSAQLPLKKLPALLQISVSCTSPPPHSTCQHSAVHTPQW